MWLRVKGMNKNKKIPPPATLSTPVCVKSKFSGCKAKSWELAWDPLLLTAAMPLTETQEDETVYTLAHHTLMSRCIMLSSCR